MTQSQKPIVRFNYPNNNGGKAAIHQSSYNTPEKYKKPIFYINIVSKFKLPDQENIPSKNTSLNTPFSLIEFCCPHINTLEEEKKYEASKCAYDEVVKTKEETKKPEIKLGGNKLKKNNGPNITSGLSDIECVTPLKNNFAQYSPPIPLTHNKKQYNYKELTTEVNCDGFSLFKLVDTNGKYRSLENSCYTNNLKTENPFLNVNLAESVVISSEEQPNSEVKLVSQIIKMSARGENNNFNR